MGTNQRGREALLGESQEIGCKSRIGGNLADENKNMCTLSVLLKIRALSDLMHIVVRF